MPQHHPGTFVAHNNINLTDVPWALTTHLFSAVVSHWLANDLQYLRVYKGLSEQTFAILRKSQTATSLADPENIETRLIAWLEAAIQNGEREEKLFNEVAEIYNLNLALSESNKNEGLRRYEGLFRQFTTAERNTFIPWLEGAVLLWATEKIYYESWSWARRQDAQSSPRTYNNDLDGGAMRREFIPNWSNRDFLMFVEQLERIINEGVSTAVKGDDALWRQVKSRTDGLYATVLDAEEAFWPSGDESTALKEAGAAGPGVGTDIDGSTLGSVEQSEVKCDKCENFGNGASTAAGMGDPPGAMSLSGTSTRRPLSGIERLPTEVVQQLASYLIIEIPSLDRSERRPNEPRLFRPGKLATLRAASRVLRAKIEYIFKQCFAVKLVPFHKYSLHRLYQLSLCPAYATLVRELSFVPHSVSAIEDDWQNNDNWALDAAMADSKVAQLRSKHAEETSFLILALNGFDNLMAIEVSPDLQQPTSANVRRHSLLSHSPTKIMAAIMESKSHLKSLAFVDSQARASEGLTPRILSRPSADVRVFNNLKTIALTLTCRNCELITVIHSSISD
ncbi:hypothetical protein FB567DRAFT_443119 [Paraphoma chrysanthemicola]|uniref:Uncharacterized protein n=1 Tax=Paraphoma chrysanthemicola TaxID=798071 RepID=A0A8K0R8G9_9PLEO|nr:hypothetical protein FB567DRAFT_443119 [Paraphoma chrysanthemicola]